jgi:hypothetical protein
VLVVGVAHLDNVFIHPSLIKFASIPKNNINKNYNSLLFMALFQADAEIIHGLLESGRFEVEVDFV